MVRSAVVMVALALTLSACGRVWPARFASLTDNGQVGTPTPTPIPNASFAVSGAIVANNTDPATIHVTLTDWQGNFLVGVTPVLDVSGTGNTHSCGPTDGTGTAQCSFKSSVPEAKLVNLSSPTANAISAPLEVLSTSAFRYVYNASAGVPVKLPLITGVSYDIKVYWGDGQSASGITASTDQAATHTYLTGGLKTILINGTFSRLKFADQPGRLTDVLYWGTQTWTSMESMFKSCTGLTVFSAVDPPNTTSTQDFGNMFEYAINFNSPLNGWVKPAANRLRGMFKGAVKFNQPLDSWDVSNVQDFSEMFSVSDVPAAPTTFDPEPAVPMIFNQALSSWNTGNATTFNRMFAGATLFNQSIANWNTSKVTNMGLMFYYAKAFNQDLIRNGSYWDVSKVTSMEMMFFRARDFNGQLGGWDPQELITLKRAFAYATNFNQPLNWGPTSTPKLASLWETFYSASAFNSEVNLDVSGVTEFYRTFAYASSFNQTLASWRPAAALPMTTVIRMDSMFIGASAFNQPLIHVEWADGMQRTRSLESMFSGATAFNQNLSTWNVSNVTNLKSMFQGATAFNNGQTDPGLEGPNLTWNTANVTNMSATFWGASNFNAGLPWSVYKVTNFYAMFFSAIKFNRDISFWNTSGATNMASMFYGASNFNQDVSSWLTHQVTTMTRMFIDAAKFNNGAECGSGLITMGGDTADTLKWNTGQVTDMSRMFEGAACFNSSLFFDTRKVLNMYNMFNGAVTYDQPMDYVAAMPEYYWDTSKVTNMMGIFHGAADFNQPLNSWIVSSVKDFTWAFLGASSFNQPLDLWDTSSATKMTAMFHSAVSFNANIGDWVVNPNVVEYTDFAFNTPAWVLPNLKPNFMGTGGTQKRLFLTATLHTGNLGGTVGADALCMADANHPLGGAVYKALLGNSSAPLRDTGADWVLVANTPYVRTDGASVGTSSAAETLDAPYSNPLDPTFVGSHWAGLNPDWTPSGLDCNGWTDDSDGIAGSISSSAAWGPMDGACATPRPLLCVEQ